MLKFIFFIITSVVFSLFINLPLAEALWCHDFNVNLKIRDVGNEVEALQTALKKEGLLEGNPDGLFGYRTRNSLIAFQNKYKEVILAPLTLKSGTGFLGKNSKDKLNNLYSCKTSVAPITPPIPLTPITPIPVTPALVKPPVIIAPVITSISPAEGRQGTAVFTMAIRGYNFTGAKTELSDCGISPVDSYGFKLISCQILSDTNIEAQFSITGVAVVGEQYITVQTPKGGRSNIAAFSILPAKAALSITLISPNGGEQWIASSTQSVTWESAGLDKTKTVKITLGNVWQVENVPNTGAYSFTLPNVPSGNKYQIYISASGVRDQSDNYLSIIAATTTPVMITPVLPSINILSPVKGEVIKAGAKHIVRWEATNLTSGNIILYQHFEGKDPFWQYLATIPATAASYEWKVPNNVGKAGIWVGNWANDDWLVKNTVDDFTINADSN